MTRVLYMLTSIVVTILHLKQENIPHIQRTLSRIILLTLITPPWYMRSLLIPYRPQSAFMLHMTNGHIIFHVFCSSNGEILCPS